MLEELHLRDLVIFDRCSLPFAPGLNVISGETGAGKSLLASAISLALGARASAELIRAGCEAAAVRAVFGRPDDPRVAAILRENGLDDPEAETLVFARQLRAGQPSRLSLNGAPVSAALARQVTDFLFDMAAQNEHTRLTDPAYQRELLDSFGGIDPAPYREKFLAAAAILQRLEASDAQKEKVKLELERVRYKLQKIAEFAFDPESDLALENRIAALAHEEQIRAVATAGAELLAEGEDSLSERLGAFLKQCAPLAEFSRPVAAAAECLDAALASIDDAARELQAAQGGEGAEGDIDALVARSEALKNLLRLVDCPDGAAALPGAAAALRAREAELASWEVDDAALHAQLRRLCAEAAALGRELHAARLQAADKLCQRVNKELRDLEMPQANFSVRFVPLWAGAAAPAPAPAAPGKTAKAEKAPKAEKAAKAEKPRSRPGAAPANAAAPGPAPFPGDPADLVRQANSGGLYEVCFLIAPNPGEAASTLAETASGGEASRAMLAIKSALAAAHDAQTLFFDEIDSGVGGRLGDVLGRKLRELSRDRQVIVITHLPQIAAYADRHLKVAKSAAKGRTTARIEELEGDARVEEIAQMINGSAATAVTRAQAEEMLARGAR